MNQQYDIVIIGAGLIGTSLASALSQHPLRILIIEAKPPGALSYADNRTVALSYASRKIFESIGVWPKLTDTVTQIDQIHVSDQGHFGKTRLRAKDHNVDALGYVASVNQLNTALHQSISESQHVELLCAAKVSTIQLGEEFSQLKIETEAGEKEVEAKLVVAADGAKSSVRDLLGIQTTVWDYDQHALVVTVGLNRDHNNIAYERFTKEGPIAMLPLSDQHSGVIWTIRNEDVDAYRELSDDELLKRLQKMFGYRLGRLKSISERFLFPLKMSRANEQVRSNLVLLGNAAYSLHPLGAQGFNLGLRDVSALAELIVDSYKSEFNAQKLLKAYLAWRKGDQRKMIGLTDGINRLFSNNFLPLVVARNLGLLSTDMIKPIKNTLVRSTLGLAGRASNLIRGLPLE